MFGKKKREAERARIEEQKRLDEQRLAEELRAKKAAEMQANRNVPAQPDKFFLESELMADEPTQPEDSERIEDLESLEELEPLDEFEESETTDILPEEPSSADEEPEQPLDASANSEPADELPKEEASADAETAYAAPQNDAVPPSEEVSRDASAEQLEEQYEEEELVKPAKLIKLPNLIDYMLTMRLSESVKMTFASMLFKQYGKYKDIPEERAILIECLKKIFANI